jgi:uncharacterized repeat protein (TIGR01451 family)
MPKLKQFHLWRWGSLAAAITLLALCLILLGSLAAAAQGSSNPSTSDSFEIIRSNNPPATYPWERSISKTDDVRSPQQDDFDLGVSTWNMPGYARPGGVFVYGIYFQNHPDATVAAESVTLTDTLPAGTTYVGDTSGLPHTVGAGGEITWDVGTMDPGYSDAFMITVAIPPGTSEGSGVIESNQVEIATTTEGDWDPSNDAASSGPVDVWEDDVEVRVQKGPEPGDPHPGEEFQYAIESCNDRGAAVGPVTLVDTLPPGTHFVRWEPRQWWQKFWTEVSADDSEVVLEANGLPGDFCSEVVLVLELLPGVEISTTLHNLVVISADGDVNPENDEQLNTDAHVSPSRADLAVDKWFNQGVLVPGGWIEYGVSYWNQGNIAVGGWLTDTLPANTEYIPDSAWMYGDPFDPYLYPVDPDRVAWELGTISVNQGADFSFSVQIDEAAPLGTLENCVEVGHSLDEDSPGDNSRCMDVEIFDTGPNLHVEKWSQWHGQEIQYNFFAANFGDVPVSNVLITDTYPVGTTSLPEVHWPNVPGHLPVTVTPDPAENQWIFEIAEMGPGEAGWFEFYVTVVDPDARPASYTNIIEISAVGYDPATDDVNPADNYDEDLIVRPEIDRIEVWLEPNGQSSMWGEAQAGVLLTVTTPFGGEFTTTVGMDECPTCWEIGDTGIVNEGDEITVEAGEALMPVVFEVPVPFTAELDRAAGTVSGVIGGWLEQPMQVNGWWEGGFQQLNTDASGAYIATYEAIPPGAQGAAYFETMTNYTLVGFHRHFRDMSLLLQVNYDHDWIQGEYEIGHTVVLTVAKPGQVYTTELTTDHIPWWDRGGFTTDWAEWHPERPNLEPGDVVSGSIDSGYTATLQIGTVTGWVDPDNDSIEGTVLADWLPTELVDVECHPWGAPEGTPSKWSTAGTAGEPPYFCQWDPGTEWDVLPGQDIGVSYYEPEGHQVFGVFSTPWMRVNYGQDWVGGNYPVGHTFVITVTESDEITVKGIAEVETTGDGGWSGPGFETRDEDWLGARPDIAPGDRVQFHTDGYDNTVRVGDIEGTLNVSADSISGPIYADWFAVDLLDVRCEVEVGPDGPDGIDSTAGPAGDPPYVCNWSGEWDIVPGQNVAVMYIEPDDGDRVINAFWEPAPDMSVGKGSEGSGEFAPEGQAIFWIHYRNEGDADAEGVLLVDTLPPGTSYVEDTSGFPTDVDPGAGTVSWDLGTVAPEEEGQFQLVVSIPTEPDSELTNQVDISTEFDTNEDNNHAEATIFEADEPSVELYVGKNPTPGDPTPGSTYIYEIYYGNDGSVPTGLATLTDTLPECTSVLDWYSQNGYDLWSVVSTSPDFELEAPTLPGRWGDRIILRLKVDEECPLDTQLANLVELETPEGYVWQLNTDAWTREPYANAAVFKNFGWGTLVPGGQIEYNIHVANHGNLTTTVWLTDTLPADTAFAGSWTWDGREYMEIEPLTVSDSDVTWSLGEIPPGGWVNVDLRLDIDPSVAYNEVLTNCAKISIEEEDAWPHDDESCYIDHVREPGPNLRILKDYGWNGHGQIEYQITFQNVGTEPLFDVNILDTLPDGTSFNDNWWSDFWQEIFYDPLGNTPRWILPELEPGWTSRIWFQVDLDDPSGEEGLAFINHVEADIPEDVWPEDNSFEITAYTGPDLFVEKWLSGGEPRPGEIVTFTVKFGNQNQWPWETDPDPPDPPTNIVDTLPDELTFVTATNPNNPEEEWLPDEIVGNTLTWGWGPMGPGSWWIFDIVAQVSETAGEGEVIVNTIEAHSNGGDIDPLPGNNTYELSLTILPQSYYIYLPIVLKNH